jgi:acetylornithine deacetylase/succinyl-diaminopimelate desuccinylase-like protein
MDEATTRSVDAYLVAHLDEYIEMLARLCAQPSISAQGVGIDACAALVATILEEQGYNAEILPSQGYPVVVGEGKGRREKTLLFYLHYDVQPPEPLDLWHSPPFELTRRGDFFYARGVSDDKGHIVARVAALAALRHVNGALPCNVKFFIEGEEEIGSPNVASFVGNHRERLAADACIWEFGGVNGEDQPEQSLGMRGICYVELSVRTAERDAHSGLGGSIFPNAAWRLTWALSKLKDEHERILVPGFYENVKEPSDRDLEMLARLPDEADLWREVYGLKEYLKGLDGGLAWRREAVFRPTCTICGLTAGYQGQGSKTVLPAVARAKVDFRLVPEQTPEEIVEKLSVYLKREGFADVEVRLLGGQRPARVDPDHPFVSLANEAAERAYGMKPAVAPMIGGSGPLYPFVDILGLPVVAAGIGYPGGNAHAPDENIRLQDFINGVRHTAYIIEAFAREGG